MAWPMIALGDVTKPVARSGPSKSDQTFTYVDLSAVDSKSKRITNPSEVETKEAPSRAQQVLKERDILVSTVRPNLNGVAVVSPHLSGSIGSTGFTVLRANQAEILPEYLFNWVKSPKFVALMVANATGASYPAVTGKTVTNSKIPLPPLPEQQRIAAILDQADAIRTKRREVLADLDELATAIFREMFSPDKTVLETVQFSRIVSKLEGGKSIVAEDSTLSAPFRVLKISAVTSNRFRPSESKPLPLEYVPPRSHLIQKGDLLFSRANTSELVGAIALVENDHQGLVLPDNLWRIVFNEPAKVDPVFFWKLLQTPLVRRELESRSSGTGGSMKNISKAKLMTMPIPLPPLPLQQEFAKRIARINAQRETVAAALATDDELFASLQSRAFSGKL